MYSGDASSSMLNSASWSEEVHSLRHSTADWDTILAVMAKEWLKSGNGNTRNQAMAAIGNICPLISREVINP